LPFLFWDAADAELGTKARKREAKRIRDLLLQRREGRCMAASSDGRGWILANGGPRYPFHEGAEGVIHSRLAG